MPKIMTAEKAMQDALNLHPNCKHAEWTNGLDPMFRRTIVVRLWRNEECYLAGDPPRHEVEGYLYGGSDET